MSDPRRAATLTAVALLLAGGALLAKLVSTTLLVFRAQSWPTAEGIVETVTHAAETTPVVTYRFSVGATVYRGTRISLGAVEHSGLLRPGEGEAVTVHFDPEHPERCALQIANRWVQVAFCGIPLVLLVLPGLLILRFRGRIRMPPPDVAVAPRPGSAAYRPCEEGQVAVGRVARTSVSVALWQPGRAVRITKKRTWSFFWLIGAIVLLAAIYLVVRYVAPEVSWEEARTPFLGWALAITALAVLASWQSPPGSVTVDWPNDAIEVRSGRRKRVLGLRRVRAVELRGRSTGEGVTLSDSLSSPSSYWHELIVWVEPDGGEAVPFLVLSTGPGVAGRFTDSDGEALEKLAEALALQLGVPLRSPRWDSPPPFE